MEIGYCAKKKKKKKDMQFIKYKLTQWQPECH